jgi:hypothetical protein
MALGLVCVAGCRMFSPLPDMRTSADHAREVEPRCKDTSLPRAIPTASDIDSVQPAYSYVHSGPMDPDARLRGARIHVKPMAGFAKESLGRAIECHQVRVTLGMEPQVTDDPYALPDRWLETDVDSDRDGFVVLVRVDEFEDAREVLARARRFAAVKTISRNDAAP